MYPEPGENIPPVANAGINQKVKLLRGSDSQEIMLDGSNSHDPDGSIASWTWTGSENAPDPMDVMRPSVVLGEGEYEFFLQVTDNNNQESHSTDRVEIKVNRHGDQTIIYQKGVSPNQYYLGTKDTSISSVIGQEDNYGAQTYLIFFRDADPLASQRSEYRVLLQFDISDIPNNVEIVSAKLELNHFQTAITEGKTIVNAYPMKRPWEKGTGRFRGDTQDGATWLNASSNVPWQIPGGDYDNEILDSVTIPLFDSSKPAEDHWISWDILPIVQVWHLGSRSNYGILLAIEDTVDNDANPLHAIQNFYSEDHIENMHLRPRLRITIRPPSLYPNNEVNFMEQLYVGNRSDFDGQAGYQFTPNENIVITALGRPVSGAMQDSHTIQIWDEATENLVAKATVTPLSPTDEIGYKYIPLTNSVRLNAGKNYRITSTEKSGGDAWMDAGEIVNHSDIATVSTAVWGHHPETYPIYDSSLWTPQEGIGFVAPTFMYRTAITNFMNVLYTGSRNNFTGQAGYQFTPTEDIMVTALGRPVSGEMIDSHTIQIWDETTLNLVVSATVTPSSSTDDVGYKYESIANPALLTAGRTFRITSTETSGGDAWMDAGYIRNYSNVAKVGSAVYGFHPETFPAYDSTQWTLDENIGFVAPTFHYRTTKHNFMNQAYTGTRNNFTGQAGYQFTPNENIVINALGRAISGSMNNSHTICIWNESEQEIVASVSVTPSSLTDELGYKYEMIPVPVRLNAGTAYRITSTETSGGDAWMDADYIRNHSSVATVDYAIWGHNSSEYPDHDSTEWTAETDLGYVTPTFYYK